MSANQADPQPKGILNYRNHHSQAPALITGIRPYIKI